MFQGNTEAECPVGELSEQNLCCTLPADFPLKPNMSDLKRNGWVGLFSNGLFRAHIHNAHLPLSHSLSSSLRHTSPETTWVSRFQDARPQRRGGPLHSSWLTAFWSFRCTAIIICSIDSTISRASVASLPTQNLTWCPTWSPISFSPDCILVFHLVTS